MKLSTRARYGLRAMLVLAQKYGGGPVLMASISEKHEISRKYLHALLAALKRAGLVKSIRGVGGGFVLARSPDQITLNEIVRVLEGSLALVDCVDDPTTCTRSSQCAARDIWCTLTNSMDSVLAGITLEELLARQNEKDGPPMYYI